MRPVLAGTALVALLVSARLWRGGSAGRLSRASGGQHSRTRYLLLCGTRIRDRVGSTARLRARRLQAAELCLALAAELSTGQAPEPALRRAAGPDPICPTALAAAGMGGDVAEGLRVDGGLLASETLRALAAVWEVSQGSGSGLASAADGLGRAALERERIRRELSAEMAGPRATAQVLAALPVVGLLLGSGLGGSPVTWLIASPIGLGVLTVGVILEVLGVLWVRAMVRSVERHL